ncbi:Satratoxin biosynthesis SC1 cluster protein 4 [Colletotrichum orbiculare MAFF 240422]|uniref:Satratoxin biosynthesis SC1 cluster protein 4 n=1 Tax=Colletotrichum orbiculare (strain 104-T / ATCC 96160 / CBS 514.97 / LARS 414 / MAFF 240422) TaxID=1213857 RepID=N4V6V0_COLOR|nr:Satratoxin biosynthesis SC1 cluster protein 4 [Colletotrichum orbiculare MAFF 240422]
MATLTAAYYPYNDTSIDQPQRDYLKQLADFAEDQNLDDDLQNYVRGITIAFTAFAAFIVGLRFLARHLQAARYLIDDYLMLFALVVLIGNMIMNLILVDHGMGLHSGRLTLEELQWLDRTMIGAEILYVNGVNIYKIALLFLYLRIFPMPEVRKGAWICGSLTSLWTFACVIAASIQCLPLNTLWEPWKPGTCINLFLTQLCIAIPSIIVDIAILYLPIPHVLKLQMNRAQRILVLFTFLLGSYVVFTSIYRFRIFLNYTKDDVPYSLAEGLAWNIIEISSGIVSACLPTLGPIVRVLWKGLLDSAQRSGLDRYGRSSNKKSAGRSAGVTIGGGGRSGTASHARSGSKDWSKFSDAKGGSGNKSHIREEAKYGIGLKTMGGGGGGDDGSSSSSLHSSPRGSNDIELMPQSAHSVTVKSPGRTTFSEGDQGNLSAREPYHGTKLSKRGGPGTYPHHDNRIWQHREVEITTEPVEPESMLPEPNRKRISGIN